MQIENLYCKIASTEFSALASAMHLLILKYYLWYYWLWLSSIYSMMFLKLLIDILMFCCTNRKCIYLCHHTCTLKIHNYTLHCTLDCTYFGLYVSIVLSRTILHAQIEQNGYSVIWFVLSFLAILLFKNITTSFFFKKKIHLQYLRYTMYSCKL